jgi:unsaturated rhamnogalacturonyl hydrolase
LAALATQGVAASTGLCDWTAGTQALGWGTAWHAGGDSSYARLVQRWVDGCGLATYPIGHVNDGLLGYAALIAYQIDPQPGYLAFAQRTADYLMAQAERTADGTLTHFHDQVWLDTQLGVVPFLTEMTRVTGATGYRDEAATQFVRHAAHLQDATSGLYAHGWQASTDTYLSTAHWGRGNAWSALAGAQLLAVLPPTHTLRSQVVAIVQRQALALAAQQDGSGLWHTVVDRPDFYQETSGTAGILYGLACGRRGGWLPDTLATHVTAARLALWREVTPAGVLGDCSAPTAPMANAADYNAIPHDSLQLYGQGLALMAFAGCR